MLCFRDTTYCASPNCQNNCGRMLTEELKAEAIRVGLPIAMARFCDREPIEMVFEEILDSAMTLEELKASIT